MMVIPDYLIYDELLEREERGREVLEPLYLPLYRPEIDDRPQESEAEDDDALERGVIIIDMNTWLEVD